MSFRYGRYTVEHPTGPDEHHSYAPAPGLALVLASQGVTYEALSELTGYPVEYLRKMAEEGQIAPNSAVLGVEHTVIRGEQPGEVTRVEDVITPDDD
jgi:hypothetical protein